MGDDHRNRRFQHKMAAETDITHARVVASHLPV